MGFLSGVLSSVTNPFGLFDDFSGRKQQEDANNMAMTSWRLANDYNHPVQQMERLKLAGLNPNLVYGSGSVAGNTTGAPSLTGGGIKTGVESAVTGLNNIFSVAQSGANLSNTRAQTQASVAAAGASGAQAANLNAQTAINEKKAQYEEKSLIADIDYKKALAEKTKAEASITKGEAEIFGAVGGSKGAGTLANVGKGALRIGRALMRR